MKNSIIINALKLNLFLKLKNLYFEEYKLKTRLSQYYFIINKNKFNTNFNIYYLKSDIKNHEYFLNINLEILNNNKFNTNFLIKNYIKLKLINSDLLEEIYDFN